MTPEPGPRPFRAGERVKIVLPPRFDGNPHPQHKQGRVGNINEPDPQYAMFDGRLHVGMDGYYIQVDCLESLEAGPTEQELADTLASLTGGVGMVDPIRAAKAEAWDEGHSRHAQQCMIDDGGGMGTFCKNPYR